MPMLVLDLDLTVLVSQSHLDILAPLHYEGLSQTISTFGMTGNTEIKHYINLINIDHLSSLIETACTKWDSEIMILTSGAWDRDIIRNILIENLDISKASEKKVQRCHFLNIYTCQETFPELSIEQLQELDKSQRLKKYIDKHPALQQSHFVALDDNADHVNSLNNLPNVQAILALTNLLQIGEKSHSHRVKSGQKTNKIYIPVVNLSFVRT